MSRAQDEAERAAGVRQPLTPLLSAAAAVLLGILPAGISGFQIAGPALLMIAVYHWTIFRPQALPPPAIFIAGLLHDILSGGPIGLWAALLLAEYGFLMTQRRVFLARTFPIAWFGFALVAAGLTVVAWILGMAWYAAILAPMPFVLLLVASVVLYPFASWAFAKLSRRPPPRRLAARP